MSLTLMYITNQPKVAMIAEENGVDRLWVDLETLGKDERQKNMNTVKSYHTVGDVRNIAAVLTKAELMVRINPMNPNSEEEIESVISAGAERIMLPMWKSADEVHRFLSNVNGRVKTTLLLETKEALEIVDEVLREPLLDEIHIGLNDLHLSYGMTFMFELLADGTVEALCNKFKARGINYGFGGIARIGEGDLPAERIITEHYRLGSTRAILSRSFCDTSKISEVSDIRALFCENMKKLRDFEAEAESFGEEVFTKNKETVAALVKRIVDKKKGILS